MNFIERQIGKVSHFFNKIGVAIVSLTSGIAQGDTIRFLDEKRGLSFTQKADSLHIEHQPVDSAEAGAEVGLKVDQPLHEGASVYKLE